MSALRLASIQQFKLYSQRTDNGPDGKKTYSGEITAGAKKRLTKAISLMIQAAPTQYKQHPVTKKFFHHSISFLTLTLPNIDAAKDAKYCHKECLEPMLRVLRKRHQMHMYVWKAEIQTNGSIHYHITSDILISHQQLREEWNNIIRSKDLLSEFKKKYGHDNPNSTDIHSVRDIKNLEAYLIKYVTKKDQNQSPINAKIWDCSQNLKKAKYFTTVSDSNYYAKLEADFQAKISNVYAGERFVIYKYHDQPVSELLNPTDKQLYLQHLKSIRTWENSAPSQIVPKLSESAKTSTITEPTKNTTPQSTNSVSSTTQPAKFVNYQTKLYAFNYSENSTNSLYENKRAGRQSGPASPE